MKKLHIYYYCISFTTFKCKVMKEPVMKEPAFLRPNSHGSFIINSLKKYNLQNNNNIKTFSALLYVYTSQIYAQTQFVCNKIQDNLNEVMPKIFTRRTGSASNGYHLKITF